MEQIKANIFVYEDINLVNNKIGFDGNLNEENWNLNKLLIGDYYKTNQTHLQIQFSYYNLY